MKSTRIIHHSPHRFRCNRDYSRLFEQSRGHRLSHAEKAVIFPIERARIQGRTGRFLIIDHFRRDSRQILLEYLRWLKGGPGSIMFIHNKTRWRRLHGREDQIGIYSWSSPNAIRGNTFNRALMVNSEHAGAAAFRDAYRAVIAVLGFGPDSLLIIHACEFPPAYVPTTFECPGALPRLGVFPIGVPPATFSIIEINDEAPPPPGSRPVKSVKPHRRRKR